jgi:hypothetical protein
MELGFPGCPWNMMLKISLLEGTAGTILGLQETIMVRQTI